MGPRAKNHPRRPSIRPWIAARPWLSNPSRTTFFGVSAHERPSILPLVPALGLFLLLAWKLNFVCDDAFISFRYSQHLVEGHGLRFNLASEVPVEGYSNLLWVLLLAPFQALGLELPVVARWLSLSSGVALLVWLITHARHRLELSPLATLGLGLFAASMPSFALWATGGLATMPAALLTFAVYERLLGDPERPRGLQAGIAAALLALMRADGALWVAMILVAALLLALRGADDRRLRREVLLAGVIPVVVVALHVAWRMYYYGDFVPNTARAKAGFSLARLDRGLDYVLTWFLVLPPIAVVLLASMRRWRPALASVWVPAAVVIAGSLGYAIWVGGDFMPFGRFLFAAVPFVVVLFAALLARLDSSKGRGPALALGAGLLLSALNTAACFDLNIVPESWRSSFHFRHDGPWVSESGMRERMIARCDEWTSKGKALGHIAKPGESIILGVVGAMGYYSGLEVFDVYGLISPEVLDVGGRTELASPGHDYRVDTTFFADRNPTYAGCFLIEEDAPPQAMLPANWGQFPISRMVRLVPHALPASAGFEPGLELRTLTFVRRRP